MRSWIPVALPGPFHSCPYAPDSIRNQYASLSNLKHAAWANPSNPAPEFCRSVSPGNSCSANQLLVPNRVADLVDLSKLESALCYQM